MTPRKLAAGLAAAALVSIVTLTSCAQRVPYRDLEAEPRSDCIDIYRGAQGDAKRIEADTRDPAKAGCWKATWEQHADYDLFTIGFDDQGCVPKPSDKPKLVY